MSSHSPLRLHLGALRVEHPVGLLLVGLGVAVDLGGIHLRAGGRAPARISHARGVVAHDQDHGVAEVLELAQLAQHHGVTQVDVGRRRVHAQLHAQRTALRELPLELPLRQRIDGVSGEEAGCLARGVRHGANARLPPSLGARRCRADGRRNSLFHARTETGKPHTGRSRYAGAADAHHPSHCHAQRALSAHERRARTAAGGPAAAQAEAEEAAPGARDRRPLDPRGHLHGVRDADGGRRATSPASRTGRSTRARRTRCSTRTPRAARTSRRTRPASRSRSSPATRTASWWARARSRRTSRTR